MVSKNFWLLLLLGCASPEPQLPPQTSSAAGPQRMPDTAPPTPQFIPDTVTVAQDTLPSGYALTDTTGWQTMLEEGTRAVLRREGVTIDTIDITTFGVAVVGKDSLVFLPVRTDTTPITTTNPPWFESFPTQHVFWTPASRHKLRELLPFFDDYFSVPTIRGSVIQYWGVARGDKTNRLYAMRYNFRTSHLDSLFMNREDPLATDYRYHLGTPQDRGREISFHGVVLDSATWRVIRQDPPDKT